MSGTSSRLPQRVLATLSRFVRPSTAPGGATMMMAAAPRLVISSILVSTPLCSLKRRSDQRLLPFSSRGS